MRARPNRATACARIAARSSVGRLARPRRRPPSTSSTRKPVTPSLDQLGHRAAAERDHRRAAGHRLDDAEAERLLEPDEVQQRVGAAEQLRSAPPARPRRCSAPGRRRSRGATALVEVPLVLDDAGDDQRQAEPLRRPRSPRPCPCRDGCARRTAGSRPARACEREARRCRCRGGSWRGSRGADGGRRR